MQKLTNDVVIFQLIFISFRWDNKLVQAKNILVEKMIDMSAVKKISLKIEIISEHPIFYRWS